MKKNWIWLAACLMLCLAASSFFIYHVKDFGAANCLIEEEEAGSLTSSNIIANEESEIDQRPILKFQTRKKKIKAGNYYQYKIIKCNIKGKVEFSSSNEKIAVITREGELYAKQEGSAWITVSAEESKDKIKVTVLPKKIIAVDPGHSGKPASGTEPIGPGSSIMKRKDSGGTYGVSTGIREYQLTLKIAKKLRKQLRQRGYKIVLTRENSEISVSNVERAQIASKSEADIYVRIHADGIEEQSIHGVSAMYPTKQNPFVGNLSVKSQNLAECILDAVCHAADAKKRGCYGRDDLSGLNWATMPVTLIEVGFMTNPQEDLKLQEGSYQEQIASGIADGIDEYFGY